MTDKRILPLERQISNLQKEVDNAHWDGRDASRAEKELQQLIEDLNAGEFWYPLF